MKIVWLYYFLLYAFFSFSQNTFQWESGKDKIVIPFTFEDNLMIIPIEVNSVKLNMLLDSGSEPSLIFSFPQNDTINLYNTRKIRIMGLGNEEIAEGILSEGNFANINGYVNRDFEILIILDESLNFSTRIGLPVNGILGYSFFKDHLIEIDYHRKKITVYKDRDILMKRKTKSFTRLPIQIVNERPYIDVKTKFDDKEHNLKLLIDTGLADGLWIFESDTIRCGSNFFHDVLGQGIGGTVMGKRSRLDQLTLSEFRFNSPLVSYPDTTSYKQLKLINKRNGSLGSEILKRFKVLFDFKGSQLFLKKNIYYDNPFNYNMSGIELMHAGVEWIKNTVSNPHTVNPNQEEKGIVFFESTLRYRFELKPIFKIASIRKGSPADLAGLQEGDKLLKIEGRNASNLSKQKIDALLHQEEGKVIELEIERKGIPKKKYKIQLKKIL